MWSTFNPLYQGSLLLDLTVITCGPHLTLYSISGFTLTGLNSNHMRSTFNNTYHQSFHGPNYLLASLHNIKKFVWHLSCLCRTPAVKSFYQAGNITPLLHEQNCLISPHIFATVLLYTVWLSSLFISFSSNSRFGSDFGFACHRFPEK